MTETSAVRMEMEKYRRPGGWGGAGCFCAAPHPDNPDPEVEPNNFDFHFCRRLPHRDGSDHAAFTHSISVPETWPDTREDEVLPSVPGSPPF